MPNTTREMLAWMTLVAVLAAASRFTTSPVIFVAILTTQLFLLWLPGKLESRRSV